MKRPRAYRAQPRQQKSFETSSAGLTAELDVIAKLQGYTVALRQTEQHVTGSKFVLLTLNVPDNELTITGFKNLDDATTAYASTESLSGKGVDVVLVSVSAISGLRQAYPNYFLDTSRFAQTATRERGVSRG